jgi:hypothetical protein
LSLKSIPVNGLEKWEANRDWDELNEISRSQIDDYLVDDETILKLRISNKWAATRKDKMTGELLYPPGSTVNCRR